MMEMMYNKKREIVFGGMYAFYIMVADMRTAMNVARRAMEELFVVNAALG